ncbi:hypothetical protein Ancab_016980, partial [Ancistrocladus abbreviatus]
ATSARKHFDIARVLISTKPLRLISATNPVFVEGIRYPIKVFEEAFGETIFSSGVDRDKVEELWFPGDDGCNDYWDRGCESSVDPRSLFANKSHK